MAGSNCSGELSAFFAVTKSRRTVRSMSDLLRRSHGKSLHMLQLIRPTSSGKSPWPGLQAISSPGDGFGGLYTSGAMVRFPKHRMSFDNTPVFQGACSLMLNFSPNVGRVAWRLSAWRICASEIRLPDLTNTVGWPFLSLSDSWLDIHLASGALMPLSIFHDLSW